MADDINETWMFQAVLNRYPEVLLIEDKMSYPGLQYLYAIVEMQEAYQRANEGHDIDKHKDK